MDRSIFLRLLFKDEATAAARAAVQSASTSFRGLGKEAATTLNSASKGFGGFIKSVSTGFLGLVSGAAKTGFNFLTYGFRQLGSESNLAGAIAATALAGIGKSILDTAAKFERFSVATEFLTGSKEEANKFAKSMRDLSVQTIFTIDQVAELGTRIVGNTKNVEQSEGAMRALLDAVAATGGGYQEAEGVVRAWIQTNSKAIASSEELNRQFANNNIPVLRALAEHIVKNADSPLRKYIQTATGGGGAVGASKALSKSFQTASDQLPILAKRSEAAEMRLQALKDAGKENTASFKSAEASVLSYHQKLDKAQGTIQSYNSAQKTTNVTLKETKLNVEDVMAQLQNVGELNIPGTIMAAEITKALNSAYGGANKRLLQSFSGALSNLGDVIVLTTLSLVGLDKSFRPLEGSLFGNITNAILGFNEMLLSNTEQIETWGRALSTSPVGQLAVTFGVLGPILQFVLRMFGGFFAGIIWWAALGAAIGFVVDKLGLFNNMGQKMDWIQGKLGPMIDFMQQKIERVGQITDEFREKLAAKFFPDNFEEASGSWNGFLNNMATASEPIFDRIGQKIQGFKNILATGESKPPIDATWINVMERFQQILGVIGNFLVAIFKPAWDQLKQSIEESKPSFQALAETFENSKPALIAFAQIVGGLVVGAIIILMALITGLVRAFTTVLDSVIMFVTGVIQIFSGFFNIIIGLFTGNHEMIIEGFKMMASGVINVIVGFIDSVISLLGGFVMGVIDFFQGLYDTLVGRSIIPDMVNAILEWFGTLKNKAFSVVGDIVSGIKNKFLGLVKSSADWGKDIINNIVSGLKSAAEALGGVGTKLLNQAGLGDILKFQHGGVVPGRMGEEVPIIAHAGERIVPRSGADVGGFGGSQINVNITGQFNLDDPSRVRQLAEQINRLLGRQMELAQQGAGY